jgi:hypothetical protein
VIIPRHSEMTVAHKRVARLMRLAGLTGCIAAAGGAPSPPRRSGKTEAVDAATLTVALAMPGAARWGSTADSNLTGSVLQRWPMVRAPAQSVRW